MINPRRLIIVLKNSTDECFVYTDCSVTWTARGLVYTHVGRR